MRNLLLAITFIAFCSCGNSTNNENQKNALQFNVDERLLAEKFVDNLVGLQMGVPKDWHPLALLSNDSIRNKFTSLLKQDSLIQAIYVDTVNQASLICTRIPEQDKELQKITFLNPDSVYNSNKQWNSILKSNFVVNGISVNQFLLQNDALVNFRLICIDGLKHNFKIDYVMDRKTYLTQVKKIESSIGSIDSFQ